MPQIRRPWLVGLVSLLSFGLYHIYWMGVTWWELKRQLTDRRMYPIGHVIGFLIPLYGLLVWDRHFQKLDSVFRESGIAMPGRSLRSLIDAVIGWSIGGWVAAAVVQYVVSGSIAGLIYIITTVIACVLLSKVVYRAQVGLNALSQSAGSVEPQVAQD
jgi:hypothetical protein